MWERKYLDRNRGFQSQHFTEALKKAAADNPVIVDSIKHGGVPETPGTDIADPFGVSIKYKDVPVWDHHPANEKEEAIYDGVHIHSESNPLGLHSHVIGGKLSGGHSHGPQNRYGAHHHKKEPIVNSVHIDGVHVHEEGRNHPDGPHEHHPLNFG